MRKIIITMALSIAAMQAHAEGDNWHAIEGQCEHYAETSDSVCPGHVNCPGWPWLVRCMAQRAGAPPDVQARLNQCIAAIERDPRWMRIPAYRMDAQIDQVIRCSGFYR